MIEHELKDILEKTFAGAHVVVVNESHLHSGHAGSPGTGQSHFSILVVSDVFVGQSRVVRHQNVNNAAKPLFNKGLHALSIQTRTKDEYKCSQ